MDDFIIKEKLLKIRTYNAELDSFVQNIKISFNIDDESSELCIEYLDIKFYLTISYSYYYYKSLIIFTNNQSYEYYIKNIEGKIIEILKWKKVTKKELNNLIKEIFEFLPDNLFNKWGEID
jgi:hypothetical protein